MPYRFFKPILAGAQLPGRLAACLGAAIGITLTIVVCSQLPLASSDLPVIVAPLGASAVLVFAVPASPLAQPWSVVGGNILSTLVGVMVYRLVPNVELASGLAVGGAILLMSLLRCLHPPGGAAALTAVIGSDSIHAAGYGFALAPVGINSIALVLLAMLFHRISGHSYPHRPALPPPAARAEQAAAGLHTEDIDRALEDMHESFDIAREDLDLLLSRAELHAKARIGQE
ncbi:MULTISPECIES: HPP family protein [unclassified Sphingobium]|uniref:HPP family protein n=1 Tax=unclassified Sphingobium TaxID=2611147 RepID=UPI0035A724A5